MSVFDAKHFAAKIATEVEEEQKKEKNHGGTTSDHVHGQRSAP
ncbi:MAG: hypothetical protein AB4038_12875 [Prochloraceae cyanobacterium]